MINNYHTKHTIEQMEEYVKALPDEAKRNMLKDILPRKDDFVNTTYFQNSVFSGLHESYYRQVRNGQYLPTIKFADRIIDAYFSGLKDAVNKITRFIDKDPPKEKPVEPVEITPVTARRKERNRRRELTLSVGQMIFSMDFNVCPDATVVEIGDKIKIQEENGRELTLTEDELRYKYMI